MLNLARNPKKPAYCQAHVTGTGLYSAFMLDSAVRCGVVTNLQIPYFVFTSKDALIALFISEQILHSRLSKLTVSDLKDEGSCLVLQANRKPKSDP